MKNLLNYLLIILLTISSCKKEEEVIDTPINTFSPTIMTSIRGIVLDKNGEPLSGVNVSIEGSLVTTSSKGLFSFNDINTTSRALIAFDKAGYFKTSRAVESKNDVANYVRIVMDEKPADPVIFNSNSSKILQRISVCTGDVDNEFL